MELMDYLRSQGGIDPVRKVALGIWDEPRIWNKRASQIRKAGDTKRALHRFGNQWESAAYKKENAHGQVTLRRVIDFLSNPLAYHVSRTLELDQEEDAGALEIKDEPLDISSLQWASLQKELWEVLLKEVFPNNDSICPEEETLRNELRREADRLCGEAEIGGNLPLAPFSQWVRDDLQAWIPEAVNTALELRAQYSNHFYVGQTDLSLGREGGRATLSLGEYTMSVPVAMALVPRDAVSPVVVLKLEKTKKIAENLPLLCTGYCMAMVQANVHLVQLPRDGGKLEAIACRPITDDLRDQVQEYLITIINDMQAGSAEHLPFDTVVKAFGATKTKEEAPDVQKISVEKLEEIAAGHYTAYKNFNPAWKLVEARFPEQSKVQDLIQRRLQPILEGWFHG
jgi:exonuclease V gamma subunit